MALVEIERSAIEEARLKLANSLVVAPGTTNINGYEQVIGLVGEGLKEKETEERIREAAIAEETARQLLASIVAIDDPSDLPTPPITPKVKKSRNKKHIKVAERLFDPRTGIV